MTILGLVASGDPALRQQALNPVAKQFPLIGHQLAGNVHTLRRSSVIGLVIGFGGLIWGTAGLAQAGLFTMARVWNLPGPARPGYVQPLGRAALFLCVLGLGVIVTTLLTGLGTFDHDSTVIVVGVDALAAAANIGMYLAAFRVLTPSGIPTRQLVPGAVARGLAWTVLQAVGTYLVHHFLHSDSCTACLPPSSGSWPGFTWARRSGCTPLRSTWYLRGGCGRAPIIQPPLTDADRVVLSAQALQNQRYDDQLVQVSFSTRPGRAPFRDPTDDWPIICGTRPGRGRSDRHPVSRARPIRVTGQRQSCCPSPSRQA